MKSTIKIFAVFAMVVGFAVGAKAQSSANADLTASARVITQLEITQKSDLQFGDVAIGTSKSITLAGAVTGTNNGTTSVGKFKLSGNPNSDISYTLTTPNNLVYTDGSSVSHNLPITYVGQYSTDETYSAAGSNSDIVEDAATTITIPVGGILYFHLAGAVNATSAVAGQYQGTVTLSAVYN